MQQNICSPAEDIKTFTFTVSKECGVTNNAKTRAQHGLSPAGNLINMHKISKFSVGFNTQLLANT